MHFTSGFRRCVLAVVVAFLGGGFVLFPFNSIAEEAIPPDESAESFVVAPAEEEFDQFDIDADNIPDSEDSEVVVNIDVTLPAGEYHYQKLIVRDNTVFTLGSDPLKEDGFQGVALYAAELIVKSGSVISANDKGYHGGPGAPPTDNYFAGGNYGGAGNGSNSAQIYGSATTPFDLGSSGNVPNTFGGGAIQLHTDILQNDGIISANGNRSSSGGSLYIVTGAISGAGIFQANGGLMGTTAQIHGPGGGGRIAIYYENSSFIGTAEAKGGCGSYDGFSTVCAENGTVGLIDDISHNLYINSYWQFRTEDSPMVFGDILISNGAKVAMENGANITAQNITLIGGSLMTLTGQETLKAQSLLVQGNSKITVLPERVLFLEIPQIIVEAGSKISADAKGYEKGPGAPDAPNTAGASYGGRGGGELAKPVYGSIETPTDFGSSSQSFRFGGGAIRIIAADILRNEGIITASARRQVGSSDEVNSERASGGSIYITVGKLAGAGVFRADGGDTAWPYAGIAGGGGRVAIYYGENTFSGTVTALAGKYCFYGCAKAGEDGTIIMGQSSLRNPVLIVPGLLGTEIFNGEEKLWLDFLRTVLDIGDQFMDALAFKNDLTPVNDTLSLGDILKRVTIPLHSYDYSGNLISEFENQGYIEGADLFTFPYDWRFGENLTNVKNLKQKISDILVQTGKNKVDIIAHSNGGLLVKKYVVENPAEHHIDKAVFVGVPNTGAPKAVKGLLLGDSFGNPFLSQNEMRKLSRNFPVAYDLLPSREYYDNKGSYVRVIEDRLLSPDVKDLNFEETNDFLLEDHDLNMQGLENAQALHSEIFDNFDLRTVGLDLYNIVGCKAGTIGRFVERRTETIIGGTKTSSFNLEYTPGDQTVPLESATNLPVEQDKKFFALEASHGTMLTQDGIRQQIVNILSGSALPTKDGDEELISQDISECELNGKGFAVYSPVNIDVTDSEGNHLGLASDGVSTENNIPNADFEILDEHKFVYLPDDSLQAYTIKLQGTGAGTFTLVNTDIQDNQVVFEQKFADIPITTQARGEITANSTTGEPELKLDVTGDGVNDFTIQPDDEFNSVLYLQIMKATINSLDLPVDKKKAFNKKIDRVIQLIQAGKIDRAKLKAEKFRFKMEKKLSKPDPIKPKPRRISKADAQLLLDMLNKLLDNLG